MPDTIVGWSVAAACAVICATLAARFVINLGRASARPMPPMSPVDAGAEEYAERWARQQAEARADFQWREHVGLWEAEMRKRDAS